MVTDFIRYPSIENHYRTKVTDGWLKHYGNVEFVAQEKIDGANIQFLFKPTGEWKVGSRSQWIGGDYTFYGLNTVLEKPEYQEKIKQLQALSIQTGKSYRFYGEFFGDGIQKRIYYGTKRIVLFDMMMDNEFVSYQKFEEFCVNNELPYIKAHESKPLIDWLTEDVPDSSSGYSPTKDFAEGFVIKPKELVLFDSLNRIVMLKHKSEKFNEKMYVKKNPKLDPTDPKILRWRNTFGEYINPNRVASVLSKEGPMPSMTFMGAYIKHVLNDAKEDFFKDHQEEFDKMGFDDKDKKRIFNYGTEISVILRESMDETNQRTGT